MGIPVRVADFKKMDYLKGLDALIIGQNGLSDFLEVDQMCLLEFVAQGGICWIMHQDHERWTPHFLPDHLAHPILVARHFETTPGKKEYMMPWVEAAGGFLFDQPNRIGLEEMVYWEVDGNSFAQYHKKTPERIKSCATSCVINAKGWEILGSYKDAAIRDGALLLQAKYGKGLFFWNQILFPETRPARGDRVLAFWDKYLANALAYFEHFKKGEKSVVKPKAKNRSLPEKVNYKLINHIHCLDWWGAGSHPGTVNAAMKYMGFDIALMSVNNAHAFGEPVLEGLERYNDDRVLMLPGEEFHPLNWEGKEPINRLHILNMGGKTYSRDFHRCLFNQRDIGRYLRKALDYIHRNGGLASPTHSDPADDYWHDFDFDAVDIKDKPLTGLGGTSVERFWLKGGRITVLMPVDMWGIQWLRANPVFQFVYLDGKPSRKTVLEAIRKGRVMPALGIESADVRMGDCRPGDEISPEKAARLGLTIDIKSERKLQSLRVYCRDQVFVREKLNGRCIRKKVELETCDLRGYVRIEVVGDHCGLATNPFYLAE